MHIWSVPTLLLCQTIPVAADLYLPLIRNINHPLLPNSLYYSQNSERQKAHKIQDCSHLSPLCICSVEMSHKFPVSTLEHLLMFRTNSLLLQLSLLFLSPSFLGSLGASFRYRWALNILRLFNPLYNRIILPLLLPLILYDFHWAFKSPS